MEKEADCAKEEKELMAAECLGEWKQVKRTVTEVSTDSITYIGDQCDNEHVRDAPRELIAMAVADYEYDWKYETKCDKGCKPAPSGQETETASEEKTKEYNHVFQDAEGKKECTVKGEVSFTVRKWRRGGECMPE